MKDISHTIDHEHLIEKVQDDFFCSDFNDMRGTLYRYPIFVDVDAGETVVDGFSRHLTAPSEPGRYTLWQYVMNATFVKNEWEKTE